MNRRTKPYYLHAVLLLFAFLTMVPLFFVINNSLRSNPEIYHSFFGLPDSFEQAVSASGRLLRGDDTPMPVVLLSGEKTAMPLGDALRYHIREGFRGYTSAWRRIKPYMVNSLVVSIGSAFGVVLLASISAYVLSRYRFPGSRFIFFFIISTLMFPAVLTLVPGFMLVKWLGLLDSYWAMILPYVAGGQVFGLFIMKSFFDGLPEDLFEAARIDGAGHVGQYFYVVLPLSKPIFSVVFVMTVLGTWNNFLWPFVVNPGGEKHVIASGLYVLATSFAAQDMRTLFAAYILSSIPLLLLFTYATRTFIQGLTAGAFKA